MIKSLKTFINYAKTLSDEDLIKEGRLCILKILEKHIDKATGNLIYSEEVENKLIAITTISAFQTATDNRIQPKEINFISDTTSFPKELLYDTVGDLNPRKYDEWNDVYTLIQTEFKTESDLLAFAKYIVLLSLSDGNFSLAEKNILKWVEICLERISNK